MERNADIGLVGLAVMGENLVLNMESHGFTVAVYNRTVDKVEALMDAYPEFRALTLLPHALPVMAPAFRELLLRVRADDEAATPPSLQGAQWPAFAPQSSWSRRSRPQPRRSRRRSPRRSPRRQAGRS